MDNTNQIKAILEFYKSKKTRLTALQTLLGLTENTDMIKIIMQTEAIKLTLRLLESEELDIEETTSSLHVLVNLSSEEKCLDIFLGINAAVRLMRLFLIKVDKEIKIPFNNDNLFNIDLDMMLINEGILLNNKENQTKQSYEVKKILDKYVYNDKKNFSGLSEDQASAIPFILMIVTNLTVDEKGQKQLFAYDDEKTKGLIFLKVLDKYFENIYKEEMDFMTSIIANLSALKEGRVFMLENKIYEIILAQFDKLNNFKMINMLRVFRNCCFEFEKFETDLLVKEGYMLSLVFKILLESNIPQKDLIIDVSVLDSIHFTHFSKEKAKEDLETINDLIIDIFVVLTNTETAFPMVVKKGLKDEWEKVRKHLHNDKQLEDRLFVVTNFLDSHK